MLENDIHYTDYFCPICGRDSKFYHPQCVIEVCIQCGRKIKEISNRFQKNSETKSKIHTYFRDILKYDLLQETLRPERFRFFLDIHSFWILRE